MNMLRLLIASMVVLAVGMLTGDASSALSAAENQTVKIVSSLPRTGSAKQQTDSIVNGVRMALEEAGNKAGPFTVEYEDMDDATAAAGQWTAEAETRNANSAAQDKDVMAYIGPYNSGAAKISMPILNRAGLLMISPANTWPGLTKPGDWDPGEPDIYRPTKRINYTRVVPTDDLQGPLGAKWAKDMGAKKVYILDDNELYGKGIARLFHDKCEDLRIKVLGHDSIDPKALEFKSLMVKIKRLNPDLVYFGGTTQSKGGQIARDMVAAGMAKTPVMVPDGCFEEAFIEAAGAKNVNGRCYLTFGGVPVQEQLKGSGKAFVESYRKKHNSDPEAYAIYGYEAGKVALEAIRKAGQKDLAAVVDAALKIRDFDGALGRWSFDANGDTSLRTMSGSTVKNGKFEFVKLLGK